MTMTEPAPTRPARRPGPTAIELRLYAVALLAAVYLIAWRAISAEGVLAAGPAGGVVRAAPVWLDELPAGRRPALAVPAGWRVVARTGDPGPAPRVVRAPASRPLRVRTRSS